MDFVNEQHFVGLHTGEDGGHIAGAFDGRAGGYAEGGIHFGGDDVGQGGFAEARRAVDDGVIQRFLPYFRGVDGDLQGLLGLGLADELVDASWAQGNVGVIL